MTNGITEQNNKHKQRYKESYNTLCISCKTKYAKERWLFDYCPICKGKNLKDISDLDEDLNIHSQTDLNISKLLIYNNRNKQIQGEINKLIEGIK